MQILIFLIALLTGGLLSVIIKPKAKFDKGIASAYVIIALLLCINSCLVNFAEIKNKTVLDALVFVLNYGKSLSYLLIGYLTIRLLFALKFNETSAGSHRLRKVSMLTLWAISMINGFGFIIETGYKIKNFGDLVSQFDQYGYTVSFLFFIMITETLGGLGILLHFKLKTGIPSSVGLMLIMLGVVYTNWHTNAPFAYSYPAVDAFISLALMLVIYNLDKKWDKRLTDTPIYVL